MGVEEDDMSSGGTQDNALSMDEKEGSRGLSDVMIRRMKNRERQRRYRARKRLLEADNSKKSCTLNQPSITGQPKPESDSCLENIERRVYCKRDWKKDARRAHMMKKVQESSVDSSVHLPKTMAPGEIPEGCDEKSTSLVNREPQRTRAGRRDWKAEARNKKN